MTDTASTTWLVLGSSPNAERMLDVAHAAHQDAVVISTNSALQWVVPDYYLLQDPVAIKQWKDIAHEYRETHGTQIVSIRRPDIARSGLDADILLEMHNGLETRYYRDRYVNCFFSGQFTAQFALMNGAEKLLLVGHEGYPRGAREAWTVKHLPGWWQSCVDVCPDVEFVFYGKLTYEISGENVRIVNRI